MKRGIIFVSVILLLVVIAIWSPWDRYNWSLKRLFGVDEKPAVSAIQVYSLKDTLTVYLDEQNQGKVTPDSSPLEVIGLTSGNHIIKLVRDNPEYTGNYEFTKAINLAPDFTTVFAYELGPSKEFSQGHILYAKETQQSQSTGNTARLNVSTEPTGAKVSIDEKEIGVSPLADIELSLDSVHKIAITKKGYETQGFNILPEAQEQRLRLVNADLYIESNLFLIPIKIDN